MKVYAAIAAVMLRLSKTGIGKDQKNQAQGFKFRGIDDVYNALAPLLAECGLVVLPRVIDIERTDRASKSGGVLFHVVLKVEFDFVCAEDGSKHTVGPIFGEAMDSGDKAISKAMSIAYKYAAFQAFCIPTEGDNDPDATVHDVAPAYSPEQLDESVELMRKAIQLDADADAVALAVMDAHDRLNATPELYGAAADAMAKRMKNFKSAWRENVRRGKELDKGTMLPNGKAA